MFKPTPNPPDLQSETPPCDALIDSTQPQDACDSTVEDYLRICAGKHADTPYKPSAMFILVAEADTETLLAHACESLASANVMASDLAGFLHGPYRNAPLGIAQIIMLAELAVNRALDNLDPQA